MIRFHALTAFLAGAGVLVVEMTATRELAPFFGQSQYVWANVIGLILLGLALGNALGGWLADKTRSSALLGALLVAAACLVAASPFLAAPTARWLLPQALPLEAAYPYLFKGSFVVTLVCFVPPVLLLGAVPPFLVRCATRRIEDVGRRAGLLYAASTLGSIAGTFLTTHVLLPELGTRGTLLLAGTLLAAAAVPEFLAARAEGGSARRTALLLVVAVAAAGTGALAARTPSLREAVSGAALGRLVVASESRYQHLEVRERDDLPVPARVLAIDEGHDSVQSVTPDEGVLTGGLYYDYFTLLALELAGRGRLRVAILGFGAGTHARQLLALVGPRCDLSIVGVELDPAVIDLAHRELGLPRDPRLRIHVDLDARTFVDHSGELFDLVLVDCYNRQSFLPPHVSSLEFFRSARERLADGGVLALNLFGYGARDPVVEAVNRTLAAALDSEIAVCSLPRTANFLVYGVPAGELRLPASWATEGWPTECREPARRLAAPAQAFRFRPGREGPLLTDDSGELDRLQLDRLRRRAAMLLRGVR